MSNISPAPQARTFTPAALPFSPAPVANPAIDTAVRTKRSPAPQTPDTQTPAWTLQPLVAPTAEASSRADRVLQTSLGGSALRGAADKKVQVPRDATIFPLYDAYRSALNTPEIQAWLLSKGFALSTLVVKQGSISGSITRDGVSSVQTFTTDDASGWRQVSARLRAAVQGLDPDGQGVPYVSDDSDSFSRNMLLRWYGVQPPTGEGDVKRVQHALSTTDWSTLPPSRKAELEGRVQTARSAIGALDERAHLANVLTQHLADKSDDEAVALAGLEVQVSSASALARNANGKVLLDDALRSHGQVLPKTAGELRNAIRWLTAALPPPPAQGNYSHLLATTWAPGLLSAADKRVLAELSNDDEEEDEGESSGLNLLRLFGVDGILERNTPEALRTQADHFLDRVFRDPVALFWGDLLARDRSFLGASGTSQLSDTERAQWVIAAIKLQFDPDAPGRAGTVAGYDLYQPGNSGRSLAEVRADVETHLKQNKLLDPKAAPLVAHLLLASAAPEFLVPGTPATLRIGSTQWADLRLSVMFAERLGGAGCSRAMPYEEIMALSRLDARTPEEAAVLDNYGVDVVLDWALMRGLYARPADGRYTPQHYQRAIQAFDAERKQKVEALTLFNAAMPTREDLAIKNLQKVFADLSVKQLKALRVCIADPNERRNLKTSEPRTRSFVETYMSGDLKRDRWMLLAPREQPPQPARKKSPYAAEPVLGAAEQAAVDKNVQALNAKIALLPNVQDQVPGAVDTYLANLKQALSVMTRRMIADLPLPDRQALEYGATELFTLREQTDQVLTLEETPGRVEERRGRKGTLLRNEYNGVIRFFEVFPEKQLIVKRDDLTAPLSLGGTLQEHKITYGPWAPSTVQTQNGQEQPFDFAAYTSSDRPRPGVTSARIIIEKLGDTLPADVSATPSNSAGLVPDSFSSERTQEIVRRIMHGNFVHHRDTVLKLAQGELPLEQQRELLRQKDRILLGMIPFVGAIVELTKGNIVEGTRGLILDTVGAFVGGAGSTLRPLIKSTKVVAPFGAKAFRVLEKGVLVVSGFLNPLDGSASLLNGAARGVFAVPKLLSKALRPSVLTTLGSVEEKLRLCLGVHSSLFSRSPMTQGGSSQPAAHVGRNHSVPVNAVQVDGQWYVINPSTGLPNGTPLDGFEPLGTEAA